MLTALKLLLTAGLGAGYLAVAFLAAHPRVDREYDAHYLHRVADCWVPLALRAKDPRPIPPASVEVAQLGQREACRTLRKGWWYLESWGVWSNDREATLNLPRRPGAGAVELMLRGVPGPGPTIHARFALNGWTADEDIAPGTTPAVVLPLPPKDDSYNPVMHITLNRLTSIAAPEPVKPGSPDMRQVGIGLTAIRYLPAPPAADASVHGQAP